MCVPGAVLCAAAADVTLRVNLWTYRRVSQWGQKKDGLVSRSHLPAIFIIPAWTYKLQTWTKFLVPFCDSTSCDYFSPFKSADWFDSKLEDASGANSRTP